LAEEEEEEEAGEEEDVESVPRFFLESLLLLLLLLLEGEDAVDLALAEEEAVVADKEAEKGVFWRKI
jgi:hypothetical protein